MSRQWLASLLRARQVHEDIERGRLAQARRHERDARRRLLVEDERVAGLLADAAETATVHAFVAAATARQAAAATLSAAHRLHVMAEDHMHARNVATVDAARARRSAEKLTEREAAERQARTLAAAQRELDDIATRRAAP